MKTIVKNLKKKPNLLYWNGEINIAVILTILAILIAFKELTTKVEDVQNVVNDLKKEKTTRENQGLQLEIGRINSFAYDLKYTTDELNKVEVTEDQESSQKLNELTLLINLELKNKNNSSLITKL